MVLHSIFRYKVPTFWDTGKRIPAVFQAFTVLQRVCLSLSWKEGGTVYRTEHYWGWGEMVTSPLW